MTKEYKEQIVCLMHLPSGQMTPLLHTDNNRFHDKWLGCNNAQQANQMDIFLCSLNKMYGRIAPEEFVIKVITPTVDFVDVANK